jgi:hypothetical protein
MAVLSGGGQVAYLRLEEGAEAIPDGMEDKEMAGAAELVAARDAGQVVGPAPLP